MEDLPEEESEEYESYYHYHMRMTAEICFTVNTDLVSSNACKFGNSDGEFVQLCWSYNE